jgi:hypothetical protein
MFNLDQAIAEWRRQMLAAGIKTPVPLEELESHLRDDIDQQMTSGLSEQQAFESAMQRIGHADALKSEFRKTCGTKRNVMFALLWYGSTGSVLTMILNLLGLFVFHRSSSVFFSHQWWPDWFPNYVVSLSFLIIGLTNYRRQRKATKE